MFLALLLSCLLAVAASAPQSLREEFAQWAKTFEKAYDTADEELRRFEIWVANRAMIVAHNAEEQMGRRTFRLGMNALGDMPAEEYRSKMLGMRPSSRRSTGATFAASVAASEAPDAVDWRPKGVVNAVKNQAQCGSCWAFSAVAAMEGAFNWKSNGTVPSACAGNTCGPNKTPCCSFSEQELVDCVNKGADTCNKGGDPSDGIEEIAKQMGGKANTEKEYPYTSGGGTSKGQCHAQAAGVQTGITSFGSVKQGDEDALKVATWQQPVLSIGIDASQQSFQFYASGVYVEPKCKNGPDQLDHGVAIVGYGVYTGPAPGPSPGPGPGPSPAPGPEDCVNNNDAKTCSTEAGCHWCDDFCFSFPCDHQPRVASANTTGTAYWTVRNSWGASWGMDGYILMARNKDNQCGVATNAIYAEIGKADAASQIVV